MRALRNFSGARRAVFWAAGALALSAASLAAAPVKTNWLLTFGQSVKGGFVVGNPAAPAKLVEFASYTCGHCANFEMTQVPLLKSQLVATGKVSFEIRNLVRDPLDLTAALLARCGGKGRFFGNHKALMASQASWADEAKLSSATIKLLDSENTVGFMQGAYSELGLDKIMAQRGVTLAQGKACLADHAALKSVITMTSEATGPLGLQSTPSFLVNGKVVEAHDYATLKPHLIR